MACHALLMLPSHAVLRALRQHVSTVATVRRLLYFHATPDEYLCYGVEPHLLMSNLSYGTEHQSTVSRQALGNAVRVICDVSCHCCRPESAGPPVERRSRGSYGGGARGRGSSEGWTSGSEGRGSGGYGGGGGGSSSGRNEPPADLEW